MQRGISTRILLKKDSVTKGLIFSFKLKITIFHPQLQYNFYIYRSNQFCVPYRLMSSLNCAMRTWVESRAEPGVKTVVIVVIVTV